jgi:fumarate reductase flavoprotein subunit
MIHKIFLILLIFASAILFAFHISTVQNKPGFASQISAVQNKLGTCATQDCHADVMKVLPEKHMLVEGEDNITSCLQCHIPGTETHRDTHVFSAKIHVNHVSGDIKLQCSYCHVIEEAKSFALPGRSSIGIPDKQTMDALPEIAAEWAGSPYLAATHAKKNIACSSCHGEDTLPVLDDKPGNPVCFKCHGSYEQLAVKTPGLDHPSRNPHASHLGEVNCRLCHKAHEVSFAYCLECHKFPMNPIPGGRNSP